MPQAEIKFRLVPGVKTSTSRAVGFLRGHSLLNAEEGFNDALNEKSRLAVKTFMDAWVDGSNGPSNRFHGFTGGSEFRMCFVFKVKQNSRNHRLYGYLFNALPKKNKRFVLCVLCNHATKNERETDDSELERAKSWAKQPLAAQAIRQEYSDDVSGTNKGKVLKWNK